MFQPGSLGGGSGWEQSVESWELGECLWFVLSLLGWGRMSGFTVFGFMGLFRLRISMIQWFKKLLKLVTAGTVQIVQNCPDPLIPIREGSLSWMLQIQLESKSPGTGDC